MEQAAEMQQPTPIALRRPGQDLSPSTAQRVVESLLRARWPLVAILVLAIIVVTAIFGPQFSPHDPNRLNLIVARHRSAPAAAVVTEKTA